MKNILSTIPKGAFASWEVAERVCQRCDGTTDWGKGEWFWTVFCQNLPTQITLDSVCYMTYDGVIRGYFDIVDTEAASNWKYGKKGFVMVMANWHPIPHRHHQKGFQGYRYTELRP